MMMFMLSIMSKTIDKQEGTRAYFYGLPTVILICPVGRCFSCGFTGDTKKDILLPFFFFYP